jgi:hypothetical protein
MLPPSTNKRLHDWCIISHECTYTTSRLAYYFVIPAIFIPAILYFSTPTFALLAASLTFFGFSHNWNNTIRMRNYVLPYETAIQSACVIDPAKSLSAIDPENHISMHPWMDRQAYWSRVVTYERTKQGCYNRADQANVYGSAGGAPSNGALTVVEPAVRVPR